MDVVQNSQRFRVRVLKQYRTHRSSGYCDTGVQHSQKFRVGIKLFPVSRLLLWYGVLQKVPGTRIDVVQNSQKAEGTGIHVVQRTYRRYL